jgi:hypothetical protein
MRDILKGGEISGQKAYHFNGVFMGSAAAGEEGNRAVLCLYELVAIFEVMMRQLKLTQKELNKAKAHN